jgi:hypothetical protein
VPVDTVPLLTFANVFGRDTAFAFHVKQTAAAGAPTARKRGSHEG